MRCRSRVDVIEPRSVLLAVEVSMLAWLSPVPACFRGGEDEADWRSALQVDQGDFLGGGVVLSRLPVSNAENPGAIA